MNQTHPSQEEILEQVQKILEERGRKALEMARQTILQEEIECKEVRNALKYFMTEYWQDLARPALLSLCCEAVGGDPEVTIPIAIPLSLISGGIDIHDDIIDQSEIKRSRPTVLGKFGKDIALLVGDALMFKGLTLLHEAAEKGVPADKIQVISGIIGRMFFKLGDAEAMELRFRGQLDLRPENYLRVMKKKAADVEAHTRISAILGNGKEEEIEALGNYGRLLGLILILGDDLMDMFDIEELQHRIHKECLPLPILYALQNPKVKPALSSILLKERITKKDAERFLEITYKIGGFNRLRKLLAELAGEARLYLKHLERDKKYLELLLQTAIPVFQNRKSNGVEADGTAFGFSSTTSPKF